MSFGKTTPILRIFDEAKALAFYVDFLGFTVDWQHRFGDDFPLYLQVSRGDCVLHLSEHHGDCTPGSALRIETDELEAFQAQLQAKQYAFARPQIQAMPWGSQDMTVVDPFGNRLVFTNGICV
ncbi:glyoxalase superfamily protein [Pseudomonas sp. St316]|uniref:glyoxalase superfamily protein n=1 Tax=Pseudomonas sp. St316 TaxID=2678257 RepID=UPI001BB32CE6|nr:glyoxalase superfamily protein [Pseudomonas sp. St316]BBP61623.1 glyoxalase [Pseudomonas sp. St316]